MKRTTKSSQHPVLQLRTEHVRVLSDDQLHAVAAGVGRVSSGVCYPPPTGGGPYG